jgi:multidrug efflux pump
MARYFIDRPIFAWVIAIVIMLAGALSLASLPVSQYPAIAPPAISISATYAGASAKTVEDSVTQIIEQSMTSLDGLMYFSSTSDSNGDTSITLTFENGTNADTAQVQVQNKLSLVSSQLPSEVTKLGTEVKKASSTFLMVLGFVSEDASMGQNDIADYVVSNINDSLSRLKGVGSVQVFGAKYAMRIWLDPNKLDTYRLTIADVTSALQAQNAQIAVGELGGTPPAPGQQLNATITAQDRMQTAEQFRAIVLRANSDGSLLRLGDVARVELGSQSYSNISRYNGKPATGVAISLATGANALETAERVKAFVAAQQPHFPNGLKVVIPYDTTPFVKVSIEGVVHTLIEAVVLVFLVMYLFLQNFRATLIPTIAVPVVLLGTFGVLALLGFSINMLTMFAMVLAIGLLVDDAIVVVENVERLMREEGLSPLEATRKSMEQITGALVGIGLVLSAVFVPMAFMAGSTGIIYRQFSVTIVTAMALSVLVAIILTPALCATLLRPSHSVHSGFFAWFNRVFDRGTLGYQGQVRFVLGRRWRFMLVYAALLGAMVLAFMRLPSAFLPSEDQGLLMAMLQTPVGATQERTLQSVQGLENYVLEHEQDAVQGLLTVQGFSFAGSGQNAGVGFLKLKDWSERTSADASASAIGARTTGALMALPDAQGYAFGPPAVPELGTADGFVFYLQDTGNLGHAALTAARDQLLAAAARSPLLAKVRANGLSDRPQLRLDIDREKAAALGLSHSTITSTLSTAWAGQYVDDFIDRGRVKRVYVQADAPFRMVPEDFLRWSVRNDQGQMVPLSAFVSSRWEHGSPQLERYNGISAMEINGEAAHGVSSGDAMAEIERLVAQLPAGIGMAWTGMSYQERQAGAQTPRLYALSLLFVFLCLAAMYESWLIPTAVLMVAPLGILGTALAALLLGMERDVYFQVAMLTTVGLTSKNAILIVEFAKDNVERGMELIAATLQAVRDRLRPILMTSLAFGLGVLPLATASGAGSGAQRAIGTGVLGGMVVGTVLGIFLIPLFFVVVQSLFGRRPHSTGA